MRLLFALLFGLSIGCSSNAVSENEWDLADNPDSGMEMDVEPDIRESLSGVCEGRIKVKNSDFCWVNERDALLGTLYFVQSGWVSLLGSEVLYSEDLMNWESVGDGQRRLVLMQEESGLYASSPQGLWRSSDGKSWELISEQELLEMERWGDIWLGITPQEQLVSSSNGFDWVIVGEGVSELERVEDTFFAIRLEPSELIRSTDGQNWTVVGSIEDSALFGVGSVLYKNPSYSESFVSTDSGETWQEVMAIVGRRRFAGYYIGTGRGGLHKSTAGIVWEKVEMPFESRNLVISGDSLVVMGESSTFTTRDLITWTPLNEFERADFLYLTVLREAEGVWLLCDQGCKRSADFVNWDAIEGVHRTTIVYGNGVWLIPVGNTLHRSEDGQNWEVLQGMRGINFLDGKFYTRADGILESTDGLIWTASTLTDWPSLRLQGELKDPSVMLNNLRGSYEASRNIQLNMRCSESICVVDRDFTAPEDLYPDEYWITRDGVTWSEVITGGRIYNITYQRGSFWAGETYQGVDYLVRSDDAEQWERVIQVPSSLVRTFAHYAIGRDLSFISYVGTSGFISEPY